MVEFITSAGFIAFYALVSVAAGIFLELELGDPWEANPRRAARGMGYAIGWPVVCLIAAVVVLTTDGLDDDALCK